jgi:hypothetical protein
MGEGWFGGVDGWHLVISGSFYMLSGSKDILSGLYLVCVMRGGGEKCHIL